MAKYNSIHTGQEIDAAITSIDNKIDNPLIKAEGQVLTFNATTGKWEASTPASGGVTTFNGRDGAVIPSSRDYTASMVGAELAGAVSSHDGNQYAHSVLFAGKQDVISDLSTIRSGATLGATSVQPEDLPEGEVNITLTSTYISDGTNMLDISGKIDDPSQKSSGQVLIWNGNEWSATNLPDSGKIDVVKVDGTALPISPVDKSVNITGKESTVNKVTSMSTSSTDTQYPSAKAVYTSISSEAAVRQSTDNSLQSQIDAITSKSDVVDVVGTKAELNTYSKTIYVDDIIKVLVDESRANQRTYYKCTNNTTPGSYGWSYIGTEGSFYTKAEMDELLEDKQDTISDIDDIREGAMLGLTSAQSSDLPIILAQAEAYADSLDDNAVHKTGDETINGNKIFAASIQIGEIKLEAVNGGLDMSIVTA